MVKDIVYRGFYSVKFVSGALHKEIKCNEILISAFENQHNFNYYHFFNLVTCIMHTSVTQGNLHVDTLE